MDVSEKRIEVKRVDTIHTGEYAYVIILTVEGDRFKLGSNALLDISDLRKIMENELFLFLMANKIDRIPSPEDKTRLRVGKVSVVHGEDKMKMDSISSDSSKPNLFIQEFNGAQALYSQNYYANAIIKFHKILLKYELLENTGEIYLYIGKSFEALNQPGQATDAYKIVLDFYQDKTSDDAHKFIVQARSAIERLGNK